MRTVAETTPKILKIPADFQRILRGSKGGRLCFAASLAAVLCLAGTLVSRADEPAVSTATAAAPSGPPVIQFSSTTFDFGRIMQGDQVKHAFEFTNAGGSDLVISDLRTTCGCTAAVASTGPYHPGEKGQIGVSYDSRAKVGYAHKEVEVFSNSTGSPHLLTLVGVVLDQEHPKFTPGEVLFSGSCAQCHSIPAKGKKGKELYEAVCALCHDFPQTTGRKYVAPDRRRLAELPNRKLKRIISKGLARTSMPAFAYRRRGPLTKEQIDSLVEYLASLRENK